MEFRILGPLEVIEDGHALDLGGQKPRILLAALLLHANEAVSSDRLVEALWPEKPPETAQKALQVYVSQLRKLLGKDRIETVPLGYLLRIGEDELDADRCGRLLEAGLPEDALALWRGPPLSDFAYEAFAQAEIARLEGLRIAVLEERIAAEIDRGHHAELVGELEGLVAEYPLRERMRGQLMLALYRSGRQAEALDAYQQARRALVDELGIEPSRELRELHQAILNQDPALDRAATDLPGADSGRGPFVGRDTELAELGGGLDDAFAGRGRLYLLVGEPGIGKSRLTDELAARARARGARALFGRCWEAGGAPAYWPWVQSLRAYVEQSDPDAIRSQLGAGAAESRRSSPSCVSCSPSCRTRPWRSRERASDCSTPSPASSRPHRPRVPSSSCSTTCTSRTSPRSCCCASSLESSARPGSSSSAPIATWIRRFANHSLRPWWSSHASRSRDASSSVASNRQTSRTTSNAQ